MFLSVRHLTRYRYATPVRESVTEVYMQPRALESQRLLSFQLLTRPRTQLFAYPDYLGNAVYHFDVPSAHTELEIEALADVETQPKDPVPGALSESEWDELRSDGLCTEHFDMLAWHGFVENTEALDQFVRERKIDRVADPLTSLRRLGEEIYQAFDYTANVTLVDSPIGHALDCRQGVCQDFAHIMIAIARSWGIPARYVSGYLFHRKEDHDRSADDATHAWVECFLPSLGWVGFDPTNNIAVGQRHVVIAYGRDYDDVPPSRGVFKGSSESELAVSVSVTQSNTPPPQHDLLRIVRPMPRDPHTDGPEQQSKLMQQEQQQQ